MKQRLMDRLAVETLVCDGAMGTQLFHRGLRSGSCGELWNIDRPADVRAIHRDYAEAGAMLITTNTFGGTPVALDRHGASDRVDAINRAGVALAREASSDVFVLGDVGPLGVLLEPFGDLAIEDARRAFETQIASLVDADAILVETMVDPVEASEAVRASRRVAPHLPVIATFAFGAGLRTMMGSSPADCVDAARQAGASVVGANCGAGLTLEDYVRLAQELVREAGEMPVIVQPNAGLPREVDGRVVYDATPDAVAQIARQLIDAGVRIVGGCCGTTPAHVLAIARNPQAPVDRH
jgi:5-methyltetrahydrofolate--homocysteine methyltransferase